MGGMHTYISGRVCTLKTYDEVLLDARAENFSATHKSSPFGAVRITLSVYDCHTLPWVDPSDGGKPHGAPRGRVGTILARKCASGLRRPAVYDATTLYLSAVNGKQT